MEIALWLGLATTEGGSVLKVHSLREPENRAPCPEQHVSPLARVERMKQTRTKRRGVWWKEPAGISIKGFVGPNPYLQILSVNPRE